MRLRPLRRKLARVELGGPYPQREKLLGHQALLHFQMLIVG